MKLRIIVDSVLQKSLNLNDATPAEDTFPVKVGQTFQVKSREWIEGKHLRVSLENSPQAAVETWYINANHIELIEEPDDRVSAPVKTASIPVTEAEQEFANDMGCSIWLLVVSFFLLAVPMIQLASSGNNAERELELNRWGWISLITSGIGIATSGWYALTIVSDAKNAKRKRLHKAFYQLLERQGGTISVLQFAQITQLDGNDAKTYLDEEARKLNATFELGEQGGIVYHFK